MASNSQGLSFMEQLPKPTPTIYNRDGTPVQIPGQLFGVNFDRSLYNLPPPRPPSPPSSPKPSIFNCLGQALNQEPYLLNDDGTPVQIPGQLFGVNFDRSLYNLPPPRPPSPPSSPKFTNTHFFGQALMGPSLYTDGTPVPVLDQLFAVDQPPRPTHSPPPSSS